MAQYLLLLHDRPESDVSSMSPDEMQRVIQEYGAWGQKMTEAGRLLAGQKLADGVGKDLEGWQSEFSVTDSPLAEAKEVIGGFFMIEAADDAEAIDLCRSCPHLKYGGRIELRLVEALE